MRYFSFFFFSGLVSASLVRPQAVRPQVVRPTTPNVIKRQALEPIIEESDLDSRFVAQEVEDELNKALAPSPDMWSEVTSLGPITFGRLLHSGFSSTVFRIFDHPNMIIKYEVDCLRDDPDEFHPLLRDYHYMLNASNIGIAPRPLFLSPPSVLCESKQGKCQFTMTDTQYTECRNANATLRYMIMEKAQGESLHAFRARSFSRTNGAMGVRNALIVGAALIDMIHQLHTVGRVVHGDVHSPNIMIQLQPETHKPVLQFIDFGLSFAFPDRPLIESRGLGRTYTHPSKTHWQLQGFETAPRDDVLKALQTIAQIMHPFDYFDFESTMCGIGSLSLLSWKVRSNWFTDSPCDAFRELVGITNEIKTEIKTRLGHVLDTVRGMGINDPIPYGYLADEIRECAHLAIQTVSTNTTIAP